MRRFISVLAVMAMMAAIMAVMAMPAFARHGDYNTISQVNIANQQPADQAPSARRLAADFAAIDTSGE